MIVLFTAQVLRFYCRNVFNFHKNVVSLLGLTGFESTRASSEVSQIRDPKAIFPFGHPLPPPSLVFGRCNLICRMTQTHKMLELTSAFFCCLFDTCCLFVYYFLLCVFFLASPPLLILPYNSSIHSSFFLPLFFLPHTFRLSSSPSTFCPFLSSSFLKHTIIH